MKLKSVIIELMMTDSLTIIGADFLHICIEISQYQVSTPRLLF